MINVGWLNREERRRRKNMEDGVVITTVFDSEDPTIRVFRITFKKGRLDSEVEFDEDAFGNFREAVNEAYLEAKKVC